jgi:hypothetical protein
LCARHSRTMRARFALFVAVGLWWSGHGGGVVSAFTTKKSDRPAQRPAFAVNSPLDENSGATTTRTDAATTTANRDQALPLPERAFYSAYGTTAISENSNHPTATTAPFGINGAAVAYGPYFYYTQQLQNTRENDEDDDEELITIGTAVVSCLLSLILGFGLGYGT